MIEKRQRQVYISEKHYLFPYFDGITRNGTNMKNATRYRQRQVFTARGKDPSEITPNEQEILDEFKEVTGIDLLKSKKALTFNFLYKEMQDSHNPDYYAEGFPAQTAQHVVRECVTEWDSFWAAYKEWKANPSKFTGKPNLPGYATKGGRSTTTITNQDCKLKVDENGMCWAYFPFKKKMPLCIGMPQGTLKEVKIVPVNGIFKVCFTFDVEMEDVTPATTPDRIAAIDFGVDNLMAVTNNFGAECLLYKGGIVKSVNHFYNKKLAEIMSEEMLKPGCPLSKKGTPKFVPTKDSQTLTNKRNNRIHDFMLQTACHFIAWCTENRVDTIVMGVNKGWKQEVNIGKVNNQTFVGIPFSYLQSVIEYKAKEHGMNIVKQEESYTSKASFLDNDFIPVYKKDDTTKHTFSGKRKPTHYKGMYKKDGFRGLYKSADGTIINSDLNGSANILRKAFPDAFKVMPDFNRVTIIRNPQSEFIIVNQMKQAGSVRPAMSKSKLNRMSRKLVA